MPELVNQHRPSWHDRAACRESEVDFFSERAADVAAARAVCRGCPVEPQCRHFEADERYEVWGGVAAVERGYGHRRAG